MDGLCKLILKPTTLEMFWNSLLLYVEPIVNSVVKKVVKFSTAFMTMLVAESLSASIVAAGLN